MKISVMKSEHNSIRKGIILLFWLLLWQFLSIIIDNSILFTGPLEVMQELISDVQHIDFYKTIAMSLARITGGFVLGFASGLFLGVVGFFYPLIDEILAPFLSLMKSIPIASFVVLLLIWIGSNNLAVFISILVVLPNSYLHTRMGLHNTDKKLLEMADVFQMSFPKKFHYLYKPALIPFLISCIEISVGMSFKSGVAAEVIGTPKFSFGEKLYMSKIHLNTPGIFAWTIVILLASFGIEKGVLFLLKKYSTPVFLAKYWWGKNNKRNKCKKNRCKKMQTSYSSIQIENLSKKYLEKEIFHHVNLILEKGKTYCLMGPSGCGKTTFLQILLGLVTAEEGSIKGIRKQAVACVFQEPRLLEEYSGLDNAFLFGTFSKGDFLDKEEFCKILPPDAADKLAKELSGGMQRRVAILRAMVSDAEIIMLDEPFAGLDSITKEITANYILEKKGNRTLIISTHNLEDVSLLEGELIDGNKSGFNWNYGGK
jgi:ABC-type nitrate/sulfonate/bicarbonate transport system ATPase subunit/ABC-type nitrate/sulfonate/bicarbonate transport system permease component